MSRLFALLVLVAVIATASAQYYYGGLGYAGYAGSYGYVPTYGAYSYGYPAYAGYGYGYLKK